MMPWRPVADSTERGRMRQKLSQNPADIRLADTRRPLGRFWSARHRW